MATSQGVRVALIGVVFGSLRAPAMLSRMQLYRVTAAYPLTSGVLAGLLLAVAHAACLVPAAPVDPIEALRLG